MQPAYGAKGRLRVTYAVQLVSLVGERTVTREIVGPLEDEVTASLVTDEDGSLYPGQYVALRKSIPADAVNRLGFSGDSHA